MALWGNIWRLTLYSISFSFVSTHLRLTCFKVHFGPCVSNLTQPLCICALYNVFFLTLAILFSLSQGEDGSAALSDGKDCPVTLQWLSHEPLSNPESIYFIWNSFPVDSLGQFSVLLPIKVKCVRWVRERARPDMVSSPGCGYAR